MKNIFSEYLEAINAILLLAGGAIGLLLRSAWKVINFKIMKRGEENKVQQQEIEINKANLVMMQQFQTYYDENLKRVIQDFQDYKNRTDKQVQYFKEALAEKDQMILKYKKGLEDEKKVIKAAQRYIARLKKYLKDNGLQTPPIDE